MDILLHLMDVKKEALLNAQNMKQVLLKLK